MLTKWLRKTLVSLCGLALVGSFAGCSSPVTQPGGDELSDGRKGAAKSLVQAPIKVEIRQLSLNPADNQHRAVPLGGTFGGTVYNPWTLIASKTFTPNLQEFEFDVLDTKPSQASDIIMGTWVSTTASPTQTQVEFNFAVVNPNYQRAGFSRHVPGANYMGEEARFPSNDPVAANRSLFDIAGGDVAILVQGLTFQTAPGATQACWNGLGNTGWVLFARDNGLQSGKFFNIYGGTAGGPAANPDPANPFSAPATASFQLRGDTIDGGLMIEPAANLDTTSFPNVIVSKGGVMTPYALVDMSNRNAATNAVDPGKGGFLLVMRQNTWGSAVLTNPALAPAGNIEALPFSGYDETSIPWLNGSGVAANRKGTDPTNNKPGVHTVGLSVLFLHQ